MTYQSPHQAYAYKSLARKQKNNIKEGFKVFFSVKCRLQYSEKNIYKYIVLLQNPPKNTSLNYAINMQHKVFMSLFVV